MRGNVYDFARRSKPARRGKTRPGRCVTLRGPAAAPMAKGCVMPVCLIVAERMDARPANGCGSGTTKQPSPRARGARGATFPPGIASWDRSREVRYSRSWACGSSPRIARPGQGAASSAWRETAAAAGFLAALPGPGIAGSSGHGISNDGIRSDKRLIDLRTCPPSCGQGGGQPRDAPLVRMWVMMRACRNMAAARAPCGWAAA